MESNVIEKEISVTSVDVTSDVKVLDGREMYKGDPGYTPQKNIDYFDGKDGRDGVDGKDGYTPQKNVDYFDGYTPQKGTDYFTEEDKAEIVNDVLENVEGGGVPAEHEHDWYDINNAPFTGMKGDTLIWDGDTTDREVANTGFYKVSDCTPSYEELSKGVSVYSKNLSTGAEYLYSTTNSTFSVTEDSENGFCTIGTSKSSAVYIYYEGNAASVTPGIYLYRGATSCYSRLIITDYTGFEPVTVINDEALNPVAQVVGAYTVAYSGYYRFPTITVDKYGRVTYITSSYFYPATITRNGYIEASAYANLPVIKSTATKTIPAGSLKTTSEFYLNLSSNISILPVVNVYGEYTDSNGRKHMVNCDWDMYQTASETATYRLYWLTASISQPLDYDLTVYVISNHTWTNGM